jgi:GH25 family lysozyme M1 (1,4-beta-N-acetylmuramidase)
MSAAVLLATLLTAPAVSASSSAPSAAAAVSTSATSAYLEGIDVSHWQGAISWTKVATVKSFAIIKATESTDIVDSTYATNRAGAQAAGLWTGAYHFARPNATAGDAVAEADHFAAVVKLGAGDILPALDIEVTGGLTPASLTTWVTTWLNEAAARLGVKPMIYTSPSFWKNALADTRSLADAGYKTLWIAHWGVSAPTVPAQNWGGRGWTFWQYDNCGSVPGISGCVDLDRYNGTDLRAQAFSIFSLRPNAAQVKQGQSGTSTVAIVRTNFGSAVTLGASGLPAGASATFDPSPTTVSTSSMQIALPPTTPVGTYRLTITGTGGDITAQAATSLVVQDGLPPTVAAPTSSLVAGTTLGMGSVPVRAAWAASDPSGISSTGLQRQISGGPWQNIALPSVAARAAMVSVPKSSSFGVRARASDGLANTSAWIPGPTASAAVTEQSATGVGYSGTWQTSSRSWFSGGSLRYSTKSGSSVSFTFTGSSAAWASLLSASGGSAWVYVDGRFDRSVKLASSTYRSRFLVWARSWPTSGTHTIKIVVANGRVDVDAFIRLRPS